MTTEQQQLLSQLSVFKRQFYLVGGTAIALHIGHRCSIDFDLFTPKSLNHAGIMKKMTEQHISYTLLFKNTEGIHFLSNGVKITFFEFPFAIEHKVDVHKCLTMSSLLDLASMKAYALGRRSKWKDYVDLYFLLRDHFSFQDISERAEYIFGGSFSKKLFKTQLGYFDDINYAEPVEYLQNFEVSDEAIKAFLSGISFESFA